MKQGRNEGGRRRKEGKMEDGMRKRKEMILRPLPSLFLALCFQHCCRSRSISHILHVLHLRVSLLIYPNAMGVRRCPLPPTPSSFFKHHIFSHVYPTPSLFLSLSITSPTLFSYPYMQLYLSSFCPSIALSRFVYLSLYPSSAHLAF